LPGKIEATRRRVVAGLAAAGALGAGGLPVLAQGDSAQTYPTRPIRIVVGFGPGGGNDILARLVSQKLTERLGQAVVVENKPGAGAMIATELVAKAAPDGYTLLLGATGAMTINPAVYQKLSYDTVRDFAPISMIASFPLLMCVYPAAPVKSVAELVAYAKENPAKANYASSSAAFQLATELFKLRTGAPLEHIPYKSSGEMLTAVLGGEVLVALADALPVAGHVKAGTVRVLAITSARRAAEYPDVPTMTEAGVPDLEVTLWSGLFAPAATPPGIVRKLEKELMEIVKLPDLQERLKAMAVDPVGGPGQDLAGRIAAEIPRWAAIAKAANVRLD
jgi:tripartite-type tricarboxylate transporter receptor subunit TctC